jgi:hypothetical protein
MFQDCFVASVAYGSDRRVAINLHADSDNRPGLNKHGRDHFGIASGVQELIHDKEGDQRDGCCTEKSHGITSSLFNKICDQIADSYRRHMLIQKIRLFPKKLNPDTLHARREFQVKGRPISEIWEIFI